MEGVGENHDPYDEDWSTGEVAVFWDYENAKVFSQGIKLPLAENIVDLSQKFGHTRILNVYSKWRIENHKIAESLYSLGFDQRNIPMTKPNSADVMIAVDIIGCIFENPQIQTYVIITGDSDFISIINKLKKYGKTVVIIGPTGVSSEHLQISASRYYSFDELSKRELKDGEENQKHNQIGKMDDFKHQNTQDELLSYNEAIECLVTSVQRAIDEGLPTRLSPISVLMRSCNEHAYHGHKTVQHPESTSNLLKKFKTFKQFLEYAVDDGKIKLESNAEFTEIFLPDEDPTEDSAYTSIHTDWIYELNSESWKIIFQIVEESFNSNLIDPEYFGKRVNVLYQLKRIRELLNREISVRKIVALYDFLISIHVIDPMDTLDRCQLSKDYVEVKQNFLDSIISL